MNILFVVAHYYPYIGGVEYVVKSIAERLVRRGHNVLVLAGQTNINNPTEEEINGVHVIRWPTYAPGDAFHIPKKITKLFDLLKDISRSYEIIHVHSAHAVLPVITGLKIKKFNKNTKVVFTMHFHGKAHSFIRNIFWRLIWHNYINKLVETADIIHSVSPVEASQVVKKFPKARDKIIVISNGIEEDVYQYKWRGQHSETIIYAGRIEKYKGIDTAINFIGLLRKKFPNLKLVIIGRGTYISHLNRQIEKQNIGFVEVLPPLPRRDYLQKLSEALATINPSYHEAYSIFVAESLAIGTPSIVSPLIYSIYKNKPINTECKIPEKLQLVGQKAEKYGLKLLSCIERESIKDWDSITNEMIRHIYNSS